MSAANVYTPERYDERVWHLALGLEPLSATTGRRMSGGTDVRLERHPAPLHRWRQWRAGETLTAVLPSMSRHSTGRFAGRYDEAVPTVADLRVVDSGRPGAVGQGRRFVPRRVRVTIADEATVLAAEADPATPPHPLWRRVFPIALFPGAAADLPAGSTVLRGSVVRTVDPVTGAVEPVRWCRVRARDGGDDLGWAHGDDRGEFVLVVASPPGSLLVPPDPLTIQLTVGATLPPPVPDPTDPLRSQVDPLWDLPVEPLTAAANPAEEVSLTGRSFLAEHTEFGPFPVSLPLGRESSMEIALT